MDREDLGMGKPGCNPDLAKEALRLVRMAGGGQQHLDGDLATVPQVFGQIHRSHSATTDLLLDTVAIGHGGLQLFRHGGHEWKIRGERRNVGKDGRTEVKTRPSYGPLGKVPMKCRML